MKNLLLFITLSLTVWASSSIPNSIQKKLCKTLNSGENSCHNGSVIQYRRHYIMENGDLILFLYLDPQTTHRYASDPIVKKIFLIDKHGKWHETQGDNSIDTSIDAISQSPNGTLWMLTHWYSEGVYPILYHSENGKKWKRTLLPLNRNIDCCFEFLRKPCLQSKHIVLTFTNTEGDIEKSWKTPYASLIENKPLWKQIHTSPKGCFCSPVTNSIWQTIVDYDTITFIHKDTEAKVTLPNTPWKLHQLRRTYHIQIGAFKHINSLNKVRNRLNPLSHDYEFVRKEVTINNETYTKLLIGKYTSKHKAKTILQKLRKMYPNNTYIQKAYVTSIDNNLRR